MPRRLYIAALAALALTACGPRAVPHPPVPQAPPHPPRFAYADVWTRVGGVRLERDSSAFTIPYAAMRLQVLSPDTVGGILVRCIVCAVPVDGRVHAQDVIYQPRTLADAARDSLAAFVLAVREAARRRDVPALRTVMAPAFVYAPNGPDGVLVAVGSWQDDRYATLDRVPALLDRGVAQVPGTDVWAAPPAHATRPGYQQLRAGFRRVAGRWQWIFLVQPRPR
jgi:hypothetical protein